MLNDDVDLDTHLTIEKNYWKLLNNQQMVDEQQASFTIPQPKLSFSDNFILKTASCLLLNSLEWIKSSNNAFKLLE